MELREAFARLQSDQALAEKFIEDPESVLKIMGVETSDLVIQPIVGAKDAFRTVAAIRRRGPISEPLGITVCASVGWIVCASVGGDIDIGDIFSAEALEQPAVRTR